MNARDLLEIQVATLFVTSPEGRLLHSNDPERAPAPRLHLAIGAAGAVVRLRADVDAATADAIESLAAREPGVLTPEAAPRFAEDYRRVLGSSEVITEHNFGVTYRLPHETRWRGDVPLAWSGSDAGDTLMARIRQHGMPRALLDVGFADLTHFWEPWCVTLAGDEIAAIAFAARLGDAAAEIGVTTMKAFRGRGFAAAATAGWSAHPALRDRPLFYATHRDNLSSRRVIARLGLPFLGLRMQL